MVAGSLHLNPAYNGIQGDKGGNMEKEHMGILLEDINGKFNLVLEGHDVLLQEIKEVKQDAQEKFEFLSSLIYEVNKRVDKVDKKIDDVDKRLSAKIDDVDKRLSAKIDDVDKRLSEKIDAVDNRLSEKIDALDNKIDAVDKSLGEKIDAVAVDLAAHRADTESHKKRYRVSEE